jgi:hypothetical protein
VEYITAAKEKVSWFTLVTNTDVGRRHIDSVCATESRNLQNRYLSEEEAK